MKSTYTKLLALILSLSVTSSSHVAACEKHRQAAAADKEHKQNTHDQSGAAENESCACASNTAAPTPSSTGQTETSEPIRGYSLRGVVVDVLPQKGGLLVKHEEIPGVMKAMTMLLKVDETTLQAVHNDQAVTGLLVRRADGWWLCEVSAEK
jgi:hypothetical protein